MGPCFSTERGSQRAESTQKDNDLVQLRQEVNALRQELKSTNKQVQELKEAISDRNDMQIEMQAIHTRVDKLARRASQMEQQPDSDSQPEQAPVTSMQGPPDNLQHQARNKGALYALRESNHSSRLVANWTDSKQPESWQGVRWENGIVTGLALTALMLGSIPPEIGDLRGLQCLMLSSNRITALPTVVSELQGLTSLQLDGNELTSVPEEIGSLTNLQTLWLQDNQIASVPASLGHLTGLRQLLLSHNKLQTVPRELGALTLLHSLWLDGNPLVALPQSFSALTQLKRLRVDAEAVMLVPEEVRPCTVTPATTLPNLSSSMSTTSEPPRGQPPTRGRYPTTTRSAGQVPAVLGASAAIAHASRSTPSPPQSAMTHASH